MIIYVSTCLQFGNVRCIRLSFFIGFRLRSIFWLRGDICLFFIGMDWISRIWALLLCLMLRNFIIWIYMLQFLQYIRYLIFLLICYFNSWCLCRLGSFLSFMHLKMCSFLSSTLLYHLYLKIVSIRKVFHIKIWIFKYFAKFVKIIRHVGASTECFSKSQQKLTSYIQVWICYHRMIWNYLHFIKNLQCKCKSLIINL